jgi:multiple sugar transport system substrate-binding protein
VKEECAKFINWMMNSEEANDIIGGERGTPVSSAIRDYMINKGTMTEQQIDMFEYVSKAAKVAGSTPAADPSGISEVNEAFSNAGNSVLYGQVTAEEGAATFRKQATEILERNNATK